MFGPETVSVIVWPNMLVPVTVKLAPLLFAVEVMLTLWPVVNETLPLEALDPLITKLPADATLWFAAIAPWTPEEPNTNPVLLVE